MNAVLLIPQPSLSPQDHHSYSSKCNLEAGVCGRCKSLELSLQPELRQSSILQWKKVIRPHACVAVVKMLSSLQSLELTYWFLTVNSFTLLPVPCFSFGHSCLLSQLHLVLRAYGAAGLKPEIITVEDGSGFSHQLPWLKPVPAALGEELLVIKLLPVRRASWKLSAFNILMKSIIKIPTTKLLAFQRHFLHLFPLFSVL